MKKSLLASGLGVVAQVAEWSQLTPDVHVPSSHPSISKMFKLICQYVSCRKGPVFRRKLFLLHCMLIIK